MKYITYNKILNAKLGSMGFRRKNKNYFTKSFGDARQELFFIHATHNEHFVKHYTIRIKIKYPSIETLAKAMNVFTYGLGVNIGYLMPENSYQEWRVADSDSDEAVKDVIENMCFNIQSYAIPYMNNYSTLETLLQGIEEYELSNRIDYRYCQPFIYYLLGEKERALECLESILQSIRNKPIPEDFKLMQNLYGPEKNPIPVNRDLIMYSEFAMNFRDYVNNAIRTK